MTPETHALPPEPTPSDGVPVRPVDPGAVHVLFQERTTRVVLTGEIDAELGPDLLEAADDALSSSRPIEVDSHHVTFMDSTGVAFLARLASRAPRRVRLLDPPDLVAFLIETTRIASLLDVVRTDQLAAEEPSAGDSLTEEPPADAPPADRDGAEA